MKRTSLWLVLVLLFSCTAQAQESDRAAVKFGDTPAPKAVQEPAQQDSIPEISWEKADDYIGQIVLVRGTVLRTHDSGKATFLNFSEDWKGKFTGVIFSSLGCEFPVPPADLFLGREVLIQGKVKEYKGSSEIIVEKLSQIRFADGTQIAANPILTPQAAVRVAAASEGVRLMTWNLENFFDELDDPYSDDQRTNPSFIAPHRMQRISDGIHAINPDVLCVEEVENRAILEQFNRDYLADLGYEVVLFEGNDGRGIDVGVLTRLPINSVTSYRHLRFKDSAGREQKFRRDLLRVSIGGKLNADAYVVHFKSQNGGENSDVIRTSEAHAAAGIIAAEMEKDPGYRGFITGDFNEVVGESTLQEFFDIGLVDSCEGTEKVTYNQKPYLTRIDFMLFTPALAKDVKASEVVDSITGVSLKCCSDHFPVTAELSAN
ncbi:MAG: endonuclease/exonuclease/phosphatase family protein [Planctomycetota bacterium]|nr:endonuclease/exonuclease/phosphatase family protein [Planctomycetota bacterium]MDA1113692.1 endonuclease/exonuclease/phosphatase family protein [Planctomycetota bacterium]